MCRGAGVRGAGVAQCVSRACLCVYECDSRERARVRVCVVIMLIVGGGGGRRRRRRAGVPILGHSLGDEPASHFGDRPSLLLVVFLLLRF